MSHILTSQTQMEGGIEYTCQALDEMSAPYEYTGSPIQMIGWAGSQTHQADLVIRKERQAKLGFQLSSDLGFKVNGEGKVEVLADTYASSNLKRYQDFLNEVGQRHNSRRATETLRQRGFVVRDSRMGEDGHLKVRMERVGSAVGMVGR